MYKISFYNKKVEKEIEKWPSGILADFLKITELMEEHGTYIAGKKTEKIEKGLFEIRAKGKEGIGRALYCTMKGKQIIILHSFIKKTQKTPKKEIDIAKKRKKDVENG